MSRAPDRAFFGFQYLIFEGKFILQTLDRNANPKKSPHCNPWLAVFNARDSDLFCRAPVLEIRGISGELPLVHF